MSESNANAAILDQEIAWFQNVLAARFDIYFQRASAIDNIQLIPPPDITSDQSDYAQIVRTNNMGFDERLVIILALLPHLQPHVLDSFLLNNKEIARGFTEFGGWKGKSHSGFLPTGETAVFILAGDDLARRFQVTQLFHEEHFFSKQRILKIEHAANGEPFLSAMLMVATEYLNLFTTGKCDKPDYGVNFPAKLISTTLSWDDLVLNQEVMEEIENINAWLQHSDTILERWGLGKNIKPGYRALFYGPPGTGKTLTATLIGKTLGNDVYRIDLSMVVSKYIGETEKNLASVFDQAMDKNWILFFDEADALFGKRTQASSSNDRHANQEISYLLQRVEDFPGVVILATNLKGNIDEAFARRFQTSVHFAMPDADQRLKLWQGMFPDNKLLAANIDLAAIAEKFELSGGAITNAVRYGAIRAIRMKRNEIIQDDLIKGVTKELLKEGRTQ
ncbi:MAG: ATP-binding protein [Gammaproteobacteria bacterium]|nr:ATP-binding protein [Gammaproteobacteria bacterium]